LARPSTRSLCSALIAGALAAGLAGVAAAQAPPAARPANAAARGPTQLPLPPLFLKESWLRRPTDRGQAPVTPAAVSNANLTLQVYGRDARNLDISGTAGSASDVVNLWTGLSTEPVAATLRDKANYVDLSGRAKIRWVVRTSGFHVVRPVLKLADGTLLVGDHADASTTLFNQTEFAVADVRWIKLDPERVVTRGTYGPSGQAASWVENPDLTRVDEVGFADLTPGSGHGSGGWVNVGTIEVYGTPVRR
jgi:hypothetical protein